jgi:hypothetical protein
MNHFNQLTERLYTDVNQIELILIQRYPASISLRIEKSSQFSESFFSGAITTLFFREKLTQRWNPLKCQHQTLNPL